MTVSTAKMTARQFLMLGEDPPGLRLELVNGEVAVSASPAPKHSYSVIQLIYVLEGHNATNALGELHHDVDTILDVFTVRRPDILFYFADRVHLIGEKAMEGPPDLAVEVVSPSSETIDREDKFEEYREAKVRYYWLVDPERRTVQGWQLRRGRYVPTGDGAEADVIRLPPFPELDLPLARLWRPAIRKRR